MPKKSKKSKNGKAKKGKGKKGKKGVKVDRDEVLKEAIANALLWENRLVTTESAKNEYRESTRTLLHENEKLQTQVAQTEKDTIDVISFLKHEDEKKNGQIMKLQNTVKEIKKEHRIEKQRLIDDYSTEIEGLQKLLTEKTNEVKLMQSELKLVKEFRRKRAQMQKELDEIKDNVYHAENEHKDTLEKMERKFFEEKLRLQEEASRKISELAERAHAEAVNNLDETTRSIYKENVRLNEALSYHVKAGDELLQAKQKLLESNKKLLSEREMNSFIVEEKVIQTKKLEKDIRECRSKISDLEHTLTQVIKENQVEKETTSKKYERDMEKSKMENARFQRTIELKTKEMNRVKKVAKNILDQRTEVEKFFMESLEYVKNEIIRNRTQYRRDAETAYHQRMLAAHAGHAKYPKIRTFRSLKSSTNSIFSDMKEAERWDGLDTFVDIGDLTWEQREKVLRLLFAKMNGLKDIKSSAGQQPKALPPIKSASQSQHSTAMEENQQLPKPSSEKSFVIQQKAFLTETAEEDEPNKILANI